MLNASTSVAGASQPAAVPNASGGSGSSAQVCPGCGSADIDIDRSRGDSVCMGCGQVLENNMMVNDTEFMATGVGDSKRAIGQFVGQNSSTVHSHTSKSQSALNFRG